MSDSARSIFQKFGFRSVIQELHEEIREIYRSDETPWVIGYSGGKDSTAILQLVWNAIAELPKDERIKPIHVINTDTLVENPVVALWVNRSLEVMTASAEKHELPIYPHQLTPKVTNTFWVNLIGRGYPAPRLKFRWCTERLKIQPSNDFITRTVQEHGEAILVLGTRSAESSKRAATMAKHREKAVRDRLTPNASLQNSLVYTPIESWTNDDVWMYLMQAKNPWGYNNKDLLTMYRGATADGECPLVIDTNTPSCGNSRFGCWVCTLVDEDKSMTAMIQNDIEKEWMTPLLEIRNELDFRTDEARKRDKRNRDFRRMSGQVQYFEDREGHGRLIRGPYTQAARAQWLRRVLEAQSVVRKNGPPEVQEWNLITKEELEEIRRIWIAEKHEIEDLLPAIYQETTGQVFPGAAAECDPVLSREALAILREIAGENDLHYELVRNLLDIERQYRNKALRRGLFRDLKEGIARCSFTDEDDALEQARDKAHLKMSSLDEKLKAIAATEGAES